MKHPQEISTVYHSKRNGSDILLVSLVSIYMAGNPLVSSLKKSFGNHARLWRLAGERGKEKAGEEGNIEHKKHSQLPSTISQFTFRPIKQTKT
jgi:hypothetical protein